MAIQPSRNPLSWRSAVGLLLLIGGALLLADVIGWLQIGDWLWAASAAVAAVFFVLYWMHDRARWWAFIPAGALLGIATSILSSFWLLLFALDEAAVGTAFLACLGLGFGMSYLANHSMWWALIPMGALWTTAAVALLDERSLASPMGTASVMFFGMLVTFLIVSFAPGGTEKVRPWALIPAVLLAGIGVLIAGSYTSILNLIGPLTLMAIGIGLLLNVIFRKR